MTYTIPAGTSVFVRQAGDTHWFPRKHTTRREMTFPAIAKDDYWYWEFREGDWEIRAHRDEVKKGD